VASRRVIKPRSPNYLLCQIANGITPIAQSATYPLTDGTPLSANFAHGLSATPSFIRAVLLCTANDTGTGIPAGQEISMEEIFDGNDVALVFSYQADTTKIYLHYNGSAGSICCYPNNAGGGINNFTSFTNFSLKIYWRA